MEDDYAKKFLRAIKRARTDKELCETINKIYKDGFQDGHSEGLEDAKTGDF